MREILIGIFFLCIPVLGLSQDPKLDKLEMLYDQGHYAKVVRKSKRLIKDTSYVNHPLPYMWKAINQVNKDLKKGEDLEKSLKASAEDFKLFTQKKNAAYYLETYNNEILDFQEIWLNQIAEYKNGKKIKEWFSFGSFKRESNLSDLK